MVNKFEKKFEEIFNFCVYYNQLNAPLPAGGARARIAKFELNILKDLIFEKIPINDFPNLKISYSKGNGRFPKVPWIAIHPIASSVSKGLSVALCFAKDGRGIVAGLMVPNNYHLNISTVTRVDKKKSNNFLDVKGSTSSSYNNKFINPKEFYREKLNETELINHLIDSLKLLKKNS